MREESGPGTSLAEVGIEGARGLWNLSEAALYEEALRRSEGVVAADGPLACLTGLHTGRSPNDKFVVREPASGGEISWGAVNREMSPEHFEMLRKDMTASLAGRDLFVQDCSAGADPSYTLPIRVITDTPGTACLRVTSFAPIPRMRRPQGDSRLSMRRRSSPIRSGTGPDPTSPSPSASIGA